MRQTWQTIFAVKSAEPAIDGRIHVVSNWFEGLQRLAPATERFLTSRLGRKQPSVNS